MSVPATNNLPYGAVPLVVESAKGANAITSAQLTGLTNTTVYLTEITVVGGGATSAQLTSAQVSGLTGSQTMHLTVGVPAGVTAAMTPLHVKFDPPIPANAPNTPIVANMGACGSGNVAAYIVLRGFHV